MAIHLLHLSDIQFGKNHRFGSAEDFNSLFQRLADDLRLLRDEQELCPDLVVVSGDLAEWGRPREFAQARDFLERLEGVLELERSRIAVIPGNHDVNRDLCEAYFSTCKGLDEDPAVPYWPKWEPYAKMFSGYYHGVEGVEFHVDQPWSLFEMPEIGVVVAGLNSTMAESHRDKDHYGRLGEDQLHWFRKRLQDYSAKGWLRIGAVHHNPIRGATDDDENLRDVNELERILGPHLDAILHGHTHDGKLQWTRGRIPILSTGSAALVKDARPLDGEVPNQYQLIRFDDDGFCRWCRQYAPERKRWIGDTRASESGNEWWDEQKLKHAMTAPADVDISRFERTRREDLGTLDDLLTRVKEICELRQGGDVTIRRLHDDVTASDYLRITQREGEIIWTYPIGAAAVLTDASFDAFLAIHRRYRQSDLGLVSTLVYGEPPADEIIRRARAERVCLTSFVEYQGLIDFRGYLEQQTRKLADDPIYRSESYVEQQLRYKIGEERHVDDAISILRQWLLDDHGRFILVLGDFGTGKTFLLRELARRLDVDRDGIVPVLIELHALEKARDLDVLVAQHFAGFQLGFPPDKFRYMLKRGRVALFFDGFDELAVRVSYDRAIEHFSTLYSAAGDRAKVVITSRTQHFESDRQVRTVLGEKVQIAQGGRLVYLRGFDGEQIRRFLLNQLGDETAADERFRLLGEVRDLMGLSENPRMLGFISELGEEDLRGARSADGTVTAASLYQALLDRWLGFEVKRQEPRGAPRVLNKDQRWNAVTHLALCLWGRTEKNLPVSELGEEVGRAVEILAEQQMTAKEATHQVGSGTLLVRDGEGRFSFIHRSVLEWLVARRAAQDLRETGSSEVLNTQVMSPLMAEFFRDLTGRDQAADWVRQALQSDDETVEQNALLVHRRLEAVGVRIQQRLEFIDKDLPGEDFSGQNLDGSDFTRSNLTSAKLVESSLRNVSFVGAKLVDADLSGSDLRGAQFQKAELSRTRLLGADLRGADFSESVLWRTVLVGARLEENTLTAAKPFGSALPSEDFHPRSSLAISELHTPRFRLRRQDGALVGCRERPRRGRPKRKSKVCQERVFQPRRDAPRLRLRGPDGALVGGRERAGKGCPQRTSELCRKRVFQPRREAPRLRLLRQDGALVGGRERSGRGRFKRTSELCRKRVFQSRREAPRLRLLRQDGALVGS